MLRKLKLHGELAEFVGQDEFEAVIRTSAEAIKFLTCNFPKVEGYMSDKYYQVLLNKEPLDKEDLHNPIGKSDVHIVPVITGAGRGVGKILFGAALIAGAFMFSPLSFKTFTKTAIGFGSKAGIAKGIAYLGGALVLSGVSEMLTPIPKPREFSNEGDPRLSFNFAGTQNTGRAGTPVPVVYGEIITGSVVISGAIDTEQVQA